MHRRVASAAAGAAPGVQDGADRGVVVNGGGSTPAIIAESSGGSQLELLFEAGTVEGAGAAQVARAVPGGAKRAPLVKKRRGRVGVVQHLLRGELRMVQQSFAQPLIPPPLSPARPGGALQLWSPGGALRQDQVAVRCDHRHRGRWKALCFLFEEEGVGLLRKEC